MHCSLHTAITLCDRSVMIQSLTLHKESAKQEKAYYQHRHPGFEMHFVSLGHSRVTCEDRTYELDTGSGLIIPPGAYHDLVDTVNDTTRLSISFTIQEPEKQESKGDLFARAFYQAEPILMALQNTEGLQILQKIEVMLSGSMEGPYQRDKLLALCNSLLLEIADQITAERAPLPQSATGDMPDAAFRIDCFLGRNFMCNNAMPRMAEELHISTRQLHRMIQKNYHTNYRQKLSETRIKIAMDMLANTTMPIHRISEILGYSSSSNFSIFVKHYTGKTPSQIRKDSHKPGRQE